MPDDLPFDQADIISDTVPTPQAAIVATAQVRPAQSAGVWGSDGWLTWFMRLAEVGCVVTGPFGERQRGAAQDLGHRVGGQLGWQRGHAPAGPEEALDDDRPGQLCVSSRAR
jgi:hypothetical protein